MPPAARRLLALSVLLLLSAGCGKSTPARVTVVLFDLSASTNVEAIRRQYLTDFNKVLDTVTAGGTIAADIIDDNPLAHSSYPIHVTFDRYEPMKENKLDYDRRMRARRDAVAEQAEALIQRRPSGRRGTAVLDSLQLAERVFLTYKDDQKLLVIFSDMIEQSRRYDFTGENLTPARIGQIIARERSAGRIPALNGVEVCVAGAGAEKSGGISAERFLAIQQFWSQYFEAAGANLPRERYGAALLKCP